MCHIQLEEEDDVIIEIVNIMPIWVYYCNVMIDFYRPSNIIQSCVKMKVISHMQEPQASLYFLSIIDING